MGFGEYFVIHAGGRSLGENGGILTAMKTIARAASALTLFAVLTFPVIASAAFSFGVNSNDGWYLGIGSGNGAGFACGSSNICAVAATFLYIINYVLVPLLFAVAFIVFLWGVAKAYIISGGDEASREKGHQLVLWGIIGFVVMISLWGIVNVVANTFGLAGYAAPATPTSQPYPAY